MLSSISESVHSLPGTNTKAKTEATQTTPSLAHEGMASSNFELQLKRAVPPVRSIFSELNTLQLVFEFLGPGYALFVKPVSMSGVMSIMQTMHMMVVMTSKHTCTAPSAHR
jgi:hypothetical protein